MNCIIIEDQIPAQRILKKYIKDIGTLNLQATFSDALEAMQFLKTNSTDLIFLDIHLPKISGIEFLKSIPQPPAVILTTAFSDYALEGYELNIVDYLLKPFSFQRFVKAVAKVKESKRSDNSTLSEKSIFIKSGYEYIKLETKEISFIKSDMDYTEIHIKEKYHVSSESLSNWEKKLPVDLFTRIHKSYLVNISKIKKISGNRIFLETDKELPLGRAYKEAFMQKYIK